MRAAALRASTYLLVLGAAVTAWDAGAATATGTLTVTATVLKACTISGGTLAFGNYDPTSASPLNASTTLTLTCTPSTSYDIGMDSGIGSGASVSLRQMSLVTNTLGYKLFRDSGRTQNWGNTVGTDTLHATSSSSSLTNTINVYGQIPAGEAAITGAYADTVTVTVTY